MKYTKELIRETIEKENVKFLRLQFTDMLGTIKNVEVPVSQLENVFNNQVMFDGSSIEGFVRIKEADMFLKPDLETFLVLSVENTQFGKVARFICDVIKIDGTPFEGDPRYILKRQLEKMNAMGYSSFNIGFEPEFYLFKLDSLGNPTLSPSDNGSYFDQSPIDSAEDCRRDIVLTLENLGFEIEASHHEVGPGQNEINFKFDNALQACDNLQTFKIVVKNIAKRHNLHATFMPKPITGLAGNGMHMNCSLSDLEGNNVFYDTLDEIKLSSTCRHWIAGIMNHAHGFSCIANASVNSYKRLVSGFEAPCYIAWSTSNRSTFIRIPATRGNGTRTEIRSVDPTANPYLVCACVLAAGLDGIENKVDYIEPVYRNLFKMGEKERYALGIYNLPSNLKEAIIGLEKDQLMKDCLGAHTTKKYLQAKHKEWHDYETQVNDFDIKNYLLKY